ncbi:MAG: hypothetical protein M0Z52_12315 [Actinomycetota bacterium]|nr:hypothetical protein [Nitrospiraceae bacterium]MDA8157213.1 hypothetical protein [Actinomycetota bacterium]
MSQTAVYERIFDVLGVKKESSVNLDSMIRQGFSSNTLSRFKREYMVNDLVLARSIGVSPKTLQRKKKSHQKLSVLAPVKRCQKCRESFRSKQDEDMGIP